MEINDLKTIWKKANDQQVEGYWVSHEDMKAMIKKKSKATIADVVRQLNQKVRMSTLISLVAVVIGIINFPYFDTKDEFIFDGTLTRGQYGGMMIFLGLVIMAISIHARIRLRQIKVLEETSDSLKSTLTRIKEIFGKVINAGILSDSIVNPLILLFALGMGLYGEEGFRFDIRLLYMILAGGLSFLGIYRLTKYMMKRKFGRFVTAIEDRLGELEATDSENNTEKV